MFMEKLGIVNSRRNESTKSCEECTDLCIPAVDLTTGVFNLLSSRANLHLSYNPAGRTHCRLQNHHGYIKHHPRGMDGSPVDVGEVPMT